MTIISHAQNYEDVMLWRALQHVEDGFYIDVGAYLPDVDSVTQLFSDHGWRGINIEPNPEVCARLAAARPRDINLAIAVSERAGTLMLHRISDGGLSTVSPALAEQHQAQGLTSSPLEVPCETLSAVWDAHVPNDQPVHFLKVDVEGHEAAVLRSLAWERQRPWILVIEATQPNTQIPTHHAWHGLLEDAHYDLVYWDGLNRFYLAREQAELARHFTCPPNVFDGFVRSPDAERLRLVQQLHEADLNLAQALGERDALSERLAAATQSLNQLQGMHAGLEHQVEELSSAYHALARDHGWLNDMVAYTSREAEAAMRQRDYLMRRATWEPLLFRQDGKPRQLIRKLLFHTSGKPRTLFRWLVVHRDGRPRAPFEMWMAPSAPRKPIPLKPPGTEPSQEAAQEEPEAAPTRLSPRSRLFLRRLQSAQARDRNA